MRDLVCKDDKLSVTRQCELLNINRTSFYRTPKAPDIEAIEREELIKSRLDYWHTKMCYLGIRKLVRQLNEKDSILVGRKLVKRYMEEMNLRAIYPKANLSKRNQEHRIYPYLLRNMSIFMSNQVWAVDITYIKMGKSHMYLTAVIDWHSRFVVGY